MRCQVTYEVTLDHSDGSKYGSTSRQRIEDLLITKVNPEGLLAKWNSEHPGTKIEVGDVITSINGITGGANMLRERSKLAVMNMKLQKAVKARIIAR